MLYQQILAFYKENGLYQSKHDYLEKFNNLSFFESCNKITIEDIHDYCSFRNLQGVKNATINRELTIMRSAINYYNKHNQTNHYNPFNGFTLFESDFMPVYLDPIQCQKLLNAAKMYSNPMLYVYLALLLHTGCRSGELLSLKWENVHLDKGYITIRNSLSKNKKTVHKPLNHQALSILKSVEKKGDWVFYNVKTGKQYRTFRRGWLWTLDRLDFKCRIHDLRHTFASLLVSQGVPIYHVSQLLGHSDTRITQKYAHLSPNNLQSVVDMLPIFD